MNLDTVTVHSTRAKKINLFDGKQNTPIKPQFKSKFQSTEKQWRPIETSLIAHKNVIDISMMERDNSAPVLDLPNEIQNEDQQLPTGNPELTNYQTKASSLIQLPNKTGEAAKLTEKNMMPRSLSSVQNRHANSRLKAILSNNYMDTSVKLSQRESKSYRRNNNPLSMDANNTHG